MILSFVIVNYQSEKYLKDCISSIREKVLGVDCEIIIVNNDFVGNAYMRSLQLENVKIINNNKNVGFGSACNTGAKNTRGEILCFLNPDTEIVSENIQELLDEFGEDDKLAIIGPKLLNDKNEIQWWCAGMEVTMWDILLNNIGIKRSKKIWESSKKVECAWVSGAALFIKKNIFQKLGGFDEKFFMYFEDIDLCKRARNSGYKVLYCPYVVIKHLGGKSFENEKDQKLYFYKSQDYYFKKHLGKFIGGIVKILRKFCFNQF